MYAVADSLRHYACVSALPERALRFDAESCQESRNSIRQSRQLVLLERRRFPIPAKRAICLCSYCQVVWAWVLIGWPVSRQASHHQLIGPQVFQNETDTVSSSTGRIKRLIIETHSCIMFDFVPSTRQCAWDHEARSPRGKCRGRSKSKPYFGGAWLEAMHVLLLPVFGSVLNIVALFQHHGFAITKGQCSNNRSSVFLRWSKKRLAHSLGGNFQKEITRWHLSNEYLDPSSK